MRLRALSAGLLILAAQAPRAWAQVGHDPARSPYRTLRYGQFIGISTGYFGGEGGQIGVAPHDGMITGLRYDFLAAGTLSLGLQGAYGTFDRLIVDKHKGPKTGVTGPVSQSAAMVEAIIQLNLTGGKSWHGIAPFVSGGLGLVLAGRTPSDTSGFKFRTKLSVAPAVGARIFLSQRLFLKLEARSVFWQISYPDVYRTPPRDFPTEAATIPGAGKEWTTSGWYSIGLSYAFHRPF
ncbi:MAG: hypothetical protein HOP28_10610 [Gemmatimonadales bacterium]|nr:hypothetical protein [Gemmatimonadales bacterium]